MDSVFARIRKVPPINREVCREGGGGKERRRKGEGGKGRRRVKGEGGRRKREDRWVGVQISIIKKRLCLPMMDTRLVFLLPSGNEASR